MIVWVKQHPYLSGTLALFLVVLFFVLRGRSGGSAAAGRAIGPSGPSDALQAASLQAQVQQQGVQAAADAQSQTTAAALAVALAQNQTQADATTAARDVALQNIFTAGETAQYGSAAQLAAVNSTNAAQVNIADTAAQAGVQIAGIGAGRDITIAGIQGDVTKFGYAAQLQGLIDTNRTSVDLGTLQLAGLMDTNKSAVQVNLQNNETSRLGITTQGATQQLAISTVGDVQKLGIMADFGLASRGQDYAYDLQKQNETNYWESIFANDRWGGGLNQVSALATITGQTPIGVAAAVGQTQSNVATSSAWSNILGSLFGSAAKVAAAV